MAPVKTLLFSAALLSSARGENSTLTSADSACLCVFDFDRTLTGRQGDKKNCPANEVIAAIHDDAYGGGPLTLSSLATDLHKTFCKKCFLGVVSHGDAGGAHSQMRQRLLVMLNMDKAQNVRVPDLWSSPPNKQGAVTAPLVLKAADVDKHKIVHGIRDWYFKNRHVSFAASQTWFFDDKTSNIEEFKGSGYNAIQVSCKSRDHSGKHTGEIGYCGGTQSEASGSHGVHLCSKEGAADSTVVV